MVRERSWRHARGREELKTLPLRALDPPFYFQARGDSGAFQRIQQRRLARRRRLQAKFSQVVVSLVDILAARVGILITDAEGKPKHYSRFSASADNSPGCGHLSPASS